MWIVRLALRRPYTFVVMSLMIVILGVLAIVRMPTDIFPEIDIPVVSVIWPYGGVSPEEMAEVVTIRCERGLHHVGQRHRAHGIAIAAGLVDHQGLLSSQRQGGSRGGAAGGRLAVGAALAARPA